VSEALYAVVMMFIMQLDNELVDLINVNLINTYSIAFKLKTT